MRPISLSHALTAATTVALLAGVGVATGAIPNEDGQIQGCYGKRNGRLRVVDRASECRRKETPLAWDQHAAATSNAVTRMGGPTPITGYPAGSVSITTATAACHRGERAVGGGYTIDADPPPLRSTWARSRASRLLPDSALARAGRQTVGACGSRTPPVMRIRRGTSGR